MATEVRQPVAIRITRPYSSEDEFLDHEIDTLTRTSVTLIGAQSRPVGVILRFEVTLSDGSPIMRGEGRVIAFKHDVFDRLPGLTLRFTRLDKKTKALVDRAAAIREERARLALRASMDESELPPPLPADTPLETSALNAEMHEPPRVPPVEMLSENHQSNGRPEFHAPAGQDRDSLLLRLRERARALAPETVAAILQTPPTSTQE